ncbi:hypothetical protein BDL97_17G081000 [Sphagnum fallax]|nr:hypothetical protein BDL97_17G081000 [Sphagnum fallax]KAH8936371.1 hypothetical protein BDL97_17G081000 [Sphagnum fallax]
MSGRKESVTKPSSASASESCNSPSRLRELLVPSSNYGARTEENEKRIFHEVVPPSSTTTSSRSSDGSGKGANRGQTMRRNTSKEAPIDHMLLTHSSSGMWKSGHEQQLRRCAQQVTTATREFEREGGCGQQSSGRSTPRAISAPTAAIVLDLKGQDLSRGSSPRVMNTVTGRFNQRAATFANMEIMDRRRSESSGKSTPRIQAALNLEMGHTGQCVTSEELTSRVEFRESGGFSDQSSSRAYNAEDPVVDHWEWNTTPGRSTSGQASSYPMSVMMDRGYDDDTGRLTSANLAMCAGDLDTCATTMAPTPRTHSKQPTTTVPPKKQQEMMMTSLQRSSTTTPRDQVSVNVTTKEAKLSADGLSGKMEQDTKYYPNMKASSLSSNSAMPIKDGQKKSLLSFEVFRDESLRKSLAGMLGRSACNCVSGWSSVASSPDRNQSRISPRETLSPQLEALKSAIFTKEKVSDHVSLQNVTKSGVMEEHRSNGDLHWKRPGFNRIQSTFHGRLSQLEGKVSQIAAELQDTKVLLEENHHTCMCSNALFTDIQMKVASIERALTNGVSDVLLAPKLKRVRNQQTSGVNGILRLKEQPIHIKAGNAEMSGHMRRAVKLGGEDIKESSLQQRRLLNNRPSSLHEKLIGNQVGLYEKLKHSRELLQNKLTIIGGRDTRLPTGTCDDEGGMVTAEHLLSFDEAYKSGGDVNDNGMVKSQSYGDVKLSSEIPSLAVSGISNQYMDLALEPFGSSGSCETKKTACQNNGGGKKRNMPMTLLPSNISDNLTCDDVPLSEEEMDEDHCLPLGSVESPTGVRSEEATFDDEHEESLHSIGDRIATAGWFVKEGEGIALAHDDGCCSYYDVPNMEEKARYRFPENAPKGVWGDCWVVHASGSDGCSSQYLIAAMAGGGRNAAAFCSWDWYDRSIAAYHCDSAPSTSTSLGPFIANRLKNANFSTPEAGLNRRSFLTTWALDRNISGLRAKAALWWHRPCGALLASASTKLKTVSLYDVRDGELMMKLDTKHHVASMDFSSPVQWCSNSRIVVVEDEGLSLWDVEGMGVQHLHNVNLVGKQPRALHVHNMDVECSGGVRQRLTSSEHHNDGVLCTNKAVNVLDFRVPAGIAMKIPTFGEQIYSVFANGDMVLAGTGNIKTKTQTEVFSSSKENTQPSITQCKVNQWSIRQGKPMNVYTLPEMEGKSSKTSINQVWGDAQSVMALNGNGLYIFDVEQRMELQHVICPDDLAFRTFDYATSRLLLISRDRPPLWCNWP